jgi:hypothetical protein
VVYATGMLDIQLVGLKCNIEVACVPVGENVFGCTYVPEIAGELAEHVSRALRYVVVRGVFPPVSLISYLDLSAVVCSFNTS